ncbi:hypothetical protein ACFYNX_26320 [Streptomyces sp. NPDC007872]|uniref:hypothetical protein n=1 Tax=Streptomyces sp. NPDC007872 TaxID=3364782 RepID=UPI003698157D
MTLHLHLPDHLRPRWRDLPRLAALLQRRLGPPPLHPLTRPAACWLWLLTLATQHAAGRLLAHGSATVCVTGPRIPFTRRAARAAVLTASFAIHFAWIWLPLEAATWTLQSNFWPLTTAVLGFGIPLSLLVETGNLLRHTRALTSLTTTLKHLRTHTGHLWWEAGNLAAHDDDPVSGGRLVHQALRVADTHQAGLVVVASSPATHRAYLRRGFTPGPLNPRVLIRPPRPVPVR